MLHIVHYFGLCPTQGRSVNKPYHKYNVVFLQVASNFRGSMIRFVSNGIVPGGFNWRFGVEIGF